MSYFQPQIKKDAKILWDKQEVSDMELVNTIETKIYKVRKLSVMLDSDLANFYNVETKRINEAVWRNPERFPCDLFFEMTKEEVEILRSQNATFKESINARKYLPKVFTEQGVYMLATVLKSQVATEVTLTIMRALNRWSFWTLTSNLTRYTKDKQ